MRRLHWLLAVAVGLMWSASGRSAEVDLSKIDRTIAKEPAYQTKNPKYCLVVYGPEATTRIWLVIDGDTLYVDRNGNGDLTENGKKVKFERQEGRNGGGQIDAGEIAAKAGVPKNAHINVGFFGEDVYVYNEAEGRPWQRAGRDVGGNLRFSDKPQNAPVIHFNGALVINPDEAYTLARSGQETEFYTMLGTPGLGKGTFACIGYQDVPKQIHPVAIFEFPAAAKGGAPIRVDKVLAHRC